MDGAALSLIVEGSVLHAVWNLFAKKASGGLPFVWLYGLVSLVSIWPLCLLMEPMALPSFSGLAWCAIVGSAVVLLGETPSWLGGVGPADLARQAGFARPMGPSQTICVAGGFAVWRNTAQRGGHSISTAGHSIDDGRGAGY